ncbi:lantibiotic dehydratase [Longispora sp. NPDC051575]|uniref:lantibiotic dehydratase n=1 Tax=Longispora sp. NPDC051575 TaxID=3154943 RepID=UPI003431D8E4
MFPATGAALIRVAAYPTGLTLPAWPDLAAGDPESAQRWLAQVWELKTFATAVRCAAPSLAQQVDRVLAKKELAEPRRVLRLAEATVRYALRWTTRPTPFGYFAGIAPVGFGPKAAFGWGDDHRPVTRPDGEFIAEHTDRAERDLAVLRTLTVVTNPLGHRRAGMWVLPCAGAADGRYLDAQITLTPKVAAAIEAARAPIGFQELTATITGPGPGNASGAERLLAGLVRQRVLVTSTRPATTVTDPAEHLARHFQLPDPDQQVAVDLRVDAQVTMPPAVLTEAGRAASTLVAIAGRMPWWVEYHQAFVQRWGPGAAVPLRDVLDVLGMPAGYRGSWRHAPAGFTGRDRLLIQLAQQSALDGCVEVVLDDALIGRLRGDDDRPPVPHTELRFTLAADTLGDLDRGAFTLTVTSGSRNAGVAAGRFLHLLTTAELEAFGQVYRTLPTALPSADVVQLSGPPLDARLESVSRTPQMLPVLPAGDFHLAPAFTLADLAVAGDGQRLWLLSRSTGRPVEPLLFNSVLLAGLQQPVLRFLTEIWMAWTAPCSSFDWGHASDLPYLPRLRRGRSILSPARWTVDRTALPGRSEPWPTWKAAFGRLRDQLRLPAQALVGGDGVQLRLDLDNPAHLAVLRGQLAQHTRTVITEAPGNSGWSGCRPAELLLTLTHTQAEPQPARPARPVSTREHPPGPSSPWVEARLFGRTDDILADLARQIDLPLPTGWWFVRYPDPEPHLRVRLPVQDLGFAGTADDLARWARRLQHNGVLHDYALHPYRPETRHGTGPNLAAAEAVFAADSAAALRRLASDRQAATAAGMITIADGFTGDGLRWLADHAPHLTGPRLDPAQLERARTPFNDGPLAGALSDYRALTDREGLDPDRVLADLLHLHHARMVGVDLASERYCLRLARTVALTHRATS